MAIKIDLVVNGKSQSLETDPRRTLLQLLREDLHLTGSKYGCGEGQCGACTVLLDGKAVRSCITPVSLIQKKDVRTIEGLASGGRLHPVQQAFAEEGAMQCGYCIPGMIMNAAALLKEKPKPSRAEIIQAMNGNVCRCCTYPAILAAIERAAKLSAEVKGS